MGDLSSELLRTGLITKKQVDRRKVQEERRQKRNHPKNQRNKFFSVREFLEDVAKRLKKPSDMKKIFRDAHWLADDLALNRKKRARLHAFLCRIAEAITETHSQRFKEFLDKKIRKY